VIRPREVTEAWIQAEKEGEGWRKARLAGRQAEQRWVMRMLRCGYPLHVGRAVAPGYVSVWRFRKGAVEITVSTLRSLELRGKVYLVRRPDEDGVRRITLVSAREADHRALAMACELERNGDPWPTWGSTSTNPLRKASS
jgi:hypothetical protein